MPDFRRFLGFTAFTEGRGLYSERLCYDLGLYKDPYSRFGQLKMLALRDRAERQLGDDFDIRAFHDHLLGAGALPLDLLEQRMDAWMVAQ